MADAQRRRLRLSAIVNDWTTRPVEVVEGVVKLRAVTPDGQHVSVTFSDDQARLIGRDLITMADNAALFRFVGEANPLACGCDVRTYDSNDHEHELTCPIRDTFE